MNKKWLAISIVALLLGFIPVWFFVEALKPPSVVVAILGLIWGYIIFRLFANKVFG